MPESKAASNNNLWKRNKDFNALAPFFREILIRVISECVKEGLNIDMIEGYRSPDRQAYIYEEGRVRPGQNVTKEKPMGSKATNALPWQSWHQYGLAADLAFYTDKGVPYFPPKDDPRWDQMQAIAVHHGLEPLSFEKPHVQIRGGLHHTEAYRIYQKQGMLALWDIAEKGFRLTLHP